MTNYIILINKIINFNENIKQSIRYLLIFSDKMKIAFLSKKVKIVDLTKCFFYRKSKDCRPN